MAEITVYQKMQLGHEALAEVIKNELGIRLENKKGVPFAVKAHEAIMSLDLKTNEEQIKAANNFLSDLQTLKQGGIIFEEDYDKLDFVKRGKVICASARVEALLRAARRKGFVIIGKLTAVPKGDANTTYFEEHYENGKYIYILKDKHINNDRRITAPRLVNGYFAKFLLKIEISLANTMNRLVLETFEYYPEEILACASASDNGIFKTEWATLKDENGKVLMNAWGQPKRQKRVTKEYNEGSIWNVFTPEMTEKTVWRKALKKIREVLPDLRDTILAFDTDDEQASFSTLNDIENTTPAGVIIEALEAPKVDLANLTKEQKKDVREMVEIYDANEHLASLNAATIIEKYNNGVAPQDIINEHYAELYVLTRYPDYKDLYSNDLSVILGGNSNEENNA